MLDDFLIRAGLAGIGVALAAAPLGCFVVWRRMAYFGDATAHAALLGVALALSLELPVFGGVLLVSLAMALIVSGLNGRSVSTDALLGVMAHGALAIGLVAVSLLPNQRVDLSAYLFGEILAVTKTDLLIIWGGAAASVALLIWRWQALLAATLNPDLATASGVNPRREQLFLTLALALTVAVALKVVGALLIAAPPQPPGPFHGHRKPWPSWRQSSVPFRPWVGWRRPLPSTPRPARALSALPRYCLPYRRGLPLPFAASALQ